MKIKCIGGECDGVMVDVDIAQYGGGQFHRGDLFKVPKPYKPISAKDWNNGYVATMAKINYYDYQISVFNFAKDDEYFFLKPLHWTDKDAIIHQMRK